MNGILVVNKEEGMTSRDVVNILGKVFNIKKIGHTGTLDPLACGVLVVTLGNCTRLCDILTSHYKEYITTLKLGIKTDTGDITGNVIESKNYDIKDVDIKNVLDSFLGKSIQTVPIYSAVKVNGKKLYEYARNNESVSLPKREIDIKEIELLSSNDDEITFRVIVSKGTYIRSLVEDIAETLGTVGTMKYLKRTKQGMFSIDNAYSIDDIKNGNYKILNKEDVLCNLNTLDIDDVLYNKIKDGQIIDKSWDSDIICFRYKDKIVALYKTYIKDSSKAKPYIMFIN